MFNLPRPTLIAVLVFLVIFFLALHIPSCHAADLASAHAADLASTPTDAPYVQLSGGSAVVRGPAAALDLTFTEPSEQLRHAFWQESLTVLAPSTFRGAPVPGNLLLRGLFMDGYGRFDAGLGLCYMANTIPYNGEHLNFNLQMDYRFLFGATLTYTHCSDAGIKLPNLGRDIVLIGWRFH